MRRIVARSVARSVDRTIFLDFFLHFGLSHLTFISYPSFYSIFHQNCSLVAGFCRICRNCVFLLLRIILLGIFLTRHRVKVIFHRFHFRKFLRPEPNTNIHRFR